MSEHNQLEEDFRQYYISTLKQEELIYIALDHSRNLEEKAKYALIGDALLDFHLFEYLMTKPNQSKETMDAIRQNINSDENLALIGKRIGLRNYIQFPNSSTESEKDSADAYYHMTLEALIYVIFKSGGVNSSRDFFRRFIQPQVDEFILGR